MIHRTVCWVGMLALVLVAPAAAQTDIPSFDPAHPRESFDAMTQYLAHDGGRWKAENPNHDPAVPRSPSHFGLWFDHVLERQILEVRIAVYYGDSAFVGSQGYWMWHPGKTALTYVLASANGGVYEGTTEFTDVHTFTTIATLYSRESNVTYKDDNVLVSFGTHRNVSYRRGDDGQWVAQDTFEWKRITDG